jgi:signal transduction histidine kinase
MTEQNDKRTDRQSSFFRDINVEFLIHELKDPLSVIETATRLLLDKQEKFGPLTQRQHKALKRALRNSQKARNLLADLLEVGRSDAGCFQCCRFDPAAVVDEVLMETLEAADSDLWDRLSELEPAARAAVMKQHGIQVDCSDGVRNIVFCQDEAKFRQIVGNLFKNALHHRQQRLNIDMDCRADQLYVDVVDDGPGVDSAHRELIFERYTRLKACVILSRTGHGLGLAGARILARHLGGDITIRGNREPGATFSLRLPLTHEPVS